MKDYIKPTFTLAGLFPVAMASSNCSMTESELKDMVDFGGMNFDFSMSDSCTITDERLDAFCKFTSTDGGFFKVLGS